MNPVLIFTILIVLITSLITWVNWPNKFKFLKILLTSAYAICSVFVFLLVDKETKVKELTNAKAGVLQSESQPIIQNGKMMTTMTLQIGQRGGTFIAPAGNIINFSPTNGIFIGAEENDQNLFAENAISLTMNNGLMYLSAQIRDCSGHIVAEIKNNEWVINTNSAYDRNYSKNALEVKDNNGEVVLQVRYFPNKVQFLAKLYNSEGRGMAILEGGTVSWSSPPRILKGRIDPIFKYPSSLHFGESVN